MLCLSVLLGTTACDDGPSLPLPDRGLPASSASSRSGTTRPEEAEFHELAAELPGFGGYFYDAAGNLVAYVADLRQADAARERLGRTLHAKNASIPPERRRPGADVVLRQGRFSFPQLASWRDLLSDSVLNHVEGAAYVDADEQQNRIVVGIDRPGARGLVLQRALRFGVPEDGLLIETSAEAELEPGRYTEPLASYHTPTLFTQPYPMMGGMAVDWRQPGDNELFPNWCTIAFTTIYQGRIAAVTNSHCSGDRGRVDGTMYFYDLREGPEVKDPAFGNNCDWMIWQGCRNADANLFAMDSAIAGIGYIARPKLRHNTKSDERLYKEIDVANPRLKITGTSTSRVGSIVDKVGGRTGWTYGAVTKTCVDVSTNFNTKFRCQHFSSYPSAKGDSGSPVFYWNGNTVEFLGISWAAGSDHSVYSSDDRIFLDLGTLQLTPLPLSVTLVGPAYPPVTTWGQRYSAYVVGGAPPYTYRWIRNGMLYATTRTVDVATNSGPVNLLLEVIDAEGITRTASLYVQPGGPAQDWGPDPGCVDGICPT
jgi:hypothetical protein